MTLEELLALLPDNTTGAIDAADLRQIVTDLYGRDLSLPVPLAIKPSPGNFGAQLRHITLAGVVTTDQGVWTGPVVVFAPMHVAYETTVVSVGYQVTAVGAGPVMTWGLYKADSEGWPDTDGGPIISITPVAESTGEKRVDLTLPITLQPGVYWSAHVTDLTAPQDARLLSVGSTLLGIVPSSSASTYGMVLSGATALPIVPTSPRAFAPLTNGSRPWLMTLQVSTT